MCAQCMAGAVTAVGAASGLRAYVATRGWLTPRHLRIFTIALAIVAVAASATLLSGSSDQPATGKAPAAAQR